MKSKNQRKAPMKNDPTTIRDELKRLRVIESQIAKLEKERAKMEARMVQDASGSPRLLRTKHARRGLGSYALVRFRRRQLIYFIVTTVAILMIWVGAWQLIEQFIPNPWFSFAGGLLIIWATRHYY